MSLNLPKLPENVPVAGGAFTRWFGRFLLRLSGWKFVGNFPNEKKFILAVAPHTSNWDFLVGLRIKFAYNLKVNFLAKNSLFKWPIGPILKFLGGIPINRSAPQGFVGQMADNFTEAEELVVVVTPEGTRSKVGKWKTGFLHIAKQANVPVVPMQLDYAKKEVHCFAAQHIDGDVADELINIQSLFNPNSAKHPEKY